MRGNAQPRIDGINVMTAQTILSEVGLRGAGMLPAKTLQTRSVETKLTEEAYGRLESLAAERGLTLGEWVREVLLDIAQSQKPMASPTEPW